MARARNLRTDVGLTTTIATTTGLLEEQVAAILEAFAAEVKRSLSRKGAGAITIPGLMRIERKTVPACPTWPASIEVSLAPELLPGPDARCARGLHTYFQSPATNGTGHPVCGLCGEDAIDWRRLHRRKIADVEYTIAQLKTDRWQCKWWSSDIDPKAVRHASRMGWGRLENAIRRRVYQSVGRVYQMPNGKVQPFRDGSQTTDKVGKMTIIHYGQHATATCCRKCIEVWHGIPRGRELTQEEMDYLAKLLVVYVRFKLPQLGAEAHPT